MEKETNQAQMSHSQAKRAAKQKEIAAAKKNDLIASAIVYGALALVVIFFVVGIGSVIYKAATKIKASSEYSAQLEDNGFIKGVNASSSINLVDYNAIEVAKSEVEYSDDEVASAIDSQLSAHQELSTDESVIATDSSKININFVGTVDGVEFEGGTADDYDLTLGSHMFIDTFEEQLVGTKAGDQVDVNVTFPDDYQNAELAGKPAVFAVTVNGVYTAPEFTDEFVQEYLSEYATTVDGYKQYLKDTHMKDNIKTWLETYLADNTTVTKYPSAYVKNAASTKMYDDEQSYEFMNQYYQSSYGQPAYASFSDYIQMSDAEYQKQLKEDAKTSVKEDLIYQAILEKEGITVSVDDVKAAEGDSYDSSVETYGAGKVAKDFIKDKALEIVAGKVTVK